MAKELEEESVSRDEAADRLEDIAERLRGDGDFDVNVNNRTIHLSPGSKVGMQVGVREKSGLFRGDREGITIKLDWKSK